MKLLPLALLMLIPAIRRQWSITDCVLIAAATGSGFGLTEHVFRYASYPHTAHAVSGGWMVPPGFNRVFVPGGKSHEQLRRHPRGVFFGPNAAAENSYPTMSEHGGLFVICCKQQRDLRSGHCSCD